MAKNETIPGGPRMVRSAERARCHRGGVDANMAGAAMILGIPKEVLERKGGLGGIPETVQQYKAMGLR